MPYFVYAVKPGAQLERLAAHAAFRAASEEAKQRRAALPAASLERIKVIFAESEPQAEDLLLQVRDPQPAGDEG